MCARLQVCLGLVEPARELENLITVIEGDLRLEFGDWGAKPAAAAAVDGDVLVRLLETISGQHG